MKKNISSSLLFISILCTYTKNEATMKPIEPKNIGIRNITVSKNEDYKLGDIYIPKGTTNLWESNQLLTKPLLSTIFGTSKNQAILKPMGSPEIFPTLTITYKKTNLINYLIFQLSAGGYKSFALLNLGALENFLEKQVKKGEISVKDTLYTYHIDININNLGMDKNGNIKIINAIESPLLLYDNDLMKELDMLTEGPGSYN